MKQKRRKVLGIPPRKKNNGYKKNQTDISPGFLLPKQELKKYPYMGVATMALGAIIFLVSGGFNTIS